MPRSPFVLQAIHDRNIVRAEFDDYLDYVYAKADKECRGVLLNRRGRANGIEPRSLLYGQAARARAYASEEFATWMAGHRRYTWAEYEQLRFNDWNQ